MYQGRLNQTNPSIGGSYRTVSIYVPMMHKYMDSVYSGENKMAAPSVPVSAIPKRFRGENEAQLDNNQTGSGDSNELEDARSHPIKVN